LHVENLAAMPGAIDLEFRRSICQRAGSRYQSMKFSDLPKSTRWAAFALLGLTLFLIWDQYFWWKLRDEYAFGFIVPLFVAYVLYERWPRIWKGLVGERPTDRVDTSARENGFVRLAGIVLTVLAVFMVGGGLLSFLAGVLYRAMEGQNLITSNFLAFGYANILLGTVFLYSDERADGTRNSVGERWSLALLFLFPAVIWMLSVPMFSAVHKSISTFLMNKVAVVVYHSFDLLGYAIVREGSVLKLPLGDVGVEDACSGIRSLTACLFAGSFLGAVYFDRFWKKVFLVGTAMLFAFINNIFRSLFLTAWAYAKGPTGLDTHVVLFGMDMGNVHDFTGWVVLGLTVVCLLVLVKVFSIRLEYELQPEPQQSL
jgi:exosortase